MIIKLADEVFIATALLHREHPERGDFAISEIVERAEHEKLTPRLRPGFRVHVTVHCVAELPPNPARYCTLHATAPGRRRLFRPGDPVHYAREGAKTTPRPEEIPDAYRKLLEWYRREYVARSATEPGTRPPDPLLELRGSGAETWAEEPPDAYVERLRSDWS